MINDLQTNLDSLATLIETNPQQAAEQLEAMGKHLLHMASLLRNAAPRSPAGFTDRLQMEVVRDGKVIQTVDTGAVP